MRQTIARLRELLEENDHVPDTSEFVEWQKNTEEIRLLRNYYVHATWEYLPGIQDAPLGFHIPPWRNEKTRGSQQGRMRLEDLEDDAERIELAFREFMKIRSKYGV